MAASLPRLGELVLLLEGAHHGRAAGALDADHARTLRADQPHLLHLVKRLPHADEAGAAAGGVDDHVGQRPVHLLGDLVAHGLLALDAIRLLERAHVKPAMGGHALAHLDAAVGDQTVDQRHRRAQLDTFNLEEAGDVLRHVDMRGQAGDRGVGAHGAGGVAGAGDGKLPGAQAQRPG